MKNNALTPMMKQYLEIKKDYQDCILLFRLGDFYEAFFEDARKISEELQIVLTSRNGNPMAGVPHHALDQYAKKLIVAGNKVAICEQMEDPALAKGIVRRQVTRVITPGTIMEDDLLSSENNNYIMAISSYESVFPVALADISTGDVGITSCSNLSELMDIITRTGPSQLIIRESLKSVLKPLLNENTELFIEFFEDWNYALSSSSEYIKRFYGLASFDGLEMNKGELINLGALFKYFEATQFKALDYLSLPRELQKKNTMYLDSTTIENLALISSDRKNSLCGSLKITVTSMGARKLKEWILNPLTDRASIEKRLDFVEAFVIDNLALEETREYLRGVFDIERIASRLSTNRAIPRDLQALRSTLMLIPLIKEILESNSVLSELSFDIETLDSEKSLLENSLKDEPAASPGEGGVIREGYNSELDELRDLMNNSRQKMSEFEKIERKETGINNLKIKYNKVFGYFIEVSKAQTEKVPERYVRKQTLVNAERYITPELKEFEEKILSASERINKLERALYEELCSELNRSIKELQKDSQLLSQIDVYQSFALSARKHGYTRPVFSSDGTLNIKKSRHPVVERFVTDFIPNDISFNDTERFYILTGPNMSGKSTYIRQVALMAIMAQAGSFVPASKAILPIYDRVFTRIGARDDLAGGKSTFLVEMIETATILSKATEDSLVVLDEVGRGTSTFDGISIAWSVSEYLYEAIGCHTIFATHFTELTELSGMYSGIKNRTVRVSESEDGIVFLHKVVNGVASRSHGIDVARLAGIPDLVLNRSKDILKVILKTSSLDKTVKVLSSEDLKEIRIKKKGKMHRNQMNLFSK